MRFEQMDLRFANVEKRLDRHDGMLGSLEEMYASLVQMVGHSNARMDEIQSDLLELKRLWEQTDKSTAFLEHKVFEHEKQLFLLRERFESYIQERRDKES